MGDDDIVGFRFSKLEEDVSDLKETVKILTRLEAKHDQTVDSITRAFTSINDLNESVRELAAFKHKVEGSLVVSRIMWAPIVLLVLERCVNYLN